MGSRDHRAARRYRGGFTIAATVPGRIGPSIPAAPVFRALAILATLATLAAFATL